MILQKLADYYMRLLCKPDHKIAVRGFGVQHVHFALRLNEAGQLLQVVDLRQEQGKRLSPPR